MPPVPPLRSTPFVRLPGIVVALLLSLPLHARAQQSLAELRTVPSKEEVTTELRRRLVAIDAAHPLVLEGVVATTTLDLWRLYGEHGFVPLWTLERASQLTEAVMRAGLEGLLPDDYLAKRVGRVVLRMASTSPTPKAWAEADLLFSESLARYVRHLILGKVDPRTMTPSWNVPIDHERFPGSLREGIDSPDLRRWLAHLTPSHWLYTGLRGALVELKKVQARGGWSRMEQGPARRPGEGDVRMPALRVRLTVSSELAEDAPVPPDPNEFDGWLATALTSFRKSHGLSAEPLLDRAAIDALNVPVARRIEQLRVNLDRGRALLERFDRTFVLVNIASFRLYYVDEGTVTWQTRVQVGRRFRKTPIFRSALDAIVLNPTWTVPPTILRADLLPAALTEPGLFARKGLQLLTLEGKAVDLATHDFAVPAPFPYRVVQRSGPGNALGRVKFKFANRFMVYLHDTPSQALFEKDARAFSSGCIRVESPRTLAKLVLSDPAWNEGAIDAAIDTMQTRTVPVKPEVPLLLLYWTAEVDAAGQVQFFGDPYRRDAAHLAALDRPLETKRP